VPERRARGLAAARVGVSPVAAGVPGASERSSVVSLN
jgi:hypothetical protein